MEQSNVVLRYRDGRTERVTLVDTNAEQQFATVRRDRSTSDVAFSELKAIFFPRLNAEDEADTATGSTIAVEFADGEVIRGIAHYNPERNGFFLFPHDRSKNDRIFVVNAAIVSIEVEKL
jgi:hypothetical protein